MDATCAGCGRTIPDFSRVCEHCGHRRAEPLLLPTDATSLQGDPEPHTASKGFDFTPDPADFAPEGLDFPASSDPVSLDAGDLEPLEDSIFRYEPEPVVEEISAAASPGSSSVERPAEVQVPVSSNGLLFGASPAAVVASAPERPVRSNRREIVFVTLAAAIGGVVTLGWLLARTAPRPEVSVAASTAGAPSTATRTAAPGSTDSVHRNNQWTAANSAVWVGDARNAIALELEAENSVGVWLRTVRPTLIVRCSSGAIEAFVFTASAARIEPKTEDHTVQVSVDGATQVTAHWRDSEEHDALFAPDGAAFVRQLLAARTLRFGFNPHNAAPVTAEFNVAGLSTMLAPLSRQCGITF